jgi:hypothetical protein
MSDLPNSTSTGPVQPAETYQQPFYPIGRSWKPATVVVVIMIVAALIGVALTSAEVSYAPSYWIWLVPVYGILCVFTAWVRARHDLKVERPSILRQVFHWLGIAAALGLDFLIRSAGQETASAAGNYALLLLALGCFLAGVHLEWLFAIVGGLLMLALVVVVEAKEYVWLIFVAGGLFVAALIGVRWLLYKRDCKKVGQVLLVKS